MPTASPTLELWNRLAEPIQHFEATSAMLGLSHGAAELLQAVLLATSPEVEELIEAIPTLSRSMAIATTDVPVRTVGGVRGPILWSETIAARAASYGDPGLFVCASTTRAYDTAENRVLAYALKLVSNAARTVDDQRAMGHVSDLSDLIREIGHRATRQLESRTLSGVPRSRPSPRDIRRTRAGVKRTTYAPAMAVLRRASVPFAGADVEAVADETSTGYHELVLQVADKLDEKGHHLPGFRAAEGVLFAGPLSFRHPAHRGHTDHPAGVVVGNVLMVLPDAASPAAKRAGHEVDPVAAGREAGYDVVAVKGTRSVSAALNRADI